MGFAILYMEIDKNYYKICCGEFNMITIKMTSISYNSSMPLSSMHINSVLLKGNL